MPTTTTQDEYSVGLSLLSPKRAIQLILIFQVLFFVPKAFTFEIPGVNLCDLIKCSKASRDLASGFSELVDKATANAQSLLDKTQSMEGTVNKDAKDRLDHIHNIVLTTSQEVLRNQEKADEIIKNATNEITQLETKTFNDISKLLWKVDCLEKKWVLEDLKVALGKMDDIFGTHTYEVSRPYKRDNKDKFSIFKLFGSKDKKVFPIQIPFYETYDAIVEYMNDELNRPGFALDSERAIVIINTYEFLAEMAKTTSCMEGGQPEYITEYINWHRKAQKWRTLVNVNASPIN